MSDLQSVFKRARCLFSRAEVEASIAASAQRLYTTYSQRHPVVLSVMVGGLIPTAMLLSHWDFPLTLDYIHATRYGDATQGQSLQWRSYPKTDLTNRHVLLVDDILDGGVTLSALKNYCEQQGAGSVSTWVMVNKKVTRAPGGLLEPDEAAIVLTESAFLAGLGLDYCGDARNWPGLYALHPDDHDTTGYIRTKAPC